MKRGPVLAGIIVSCLLVIVFIVSVFFAMTRIRREGSGAFLGDKVAVVEIKGIIVDSRSIIDEIIRFKKNRRVKAIVLRIDSPGGAVGPSQEIYEEVRKAGKEKTVVVSMGAVAASGGYYVACAADKIIANPGTITGSIGVLMEFINVKELFKWAKLRSEVIKSGEYKDTGSPLRDMKERERHYLQEVIDSVHDQFKRAIVESRGLSASQVEEIADGRIFSGEQAKDLGLVDELGNLQDAITEAAKLAGIKGEPSVIYPERRRPRLLDFLSEAVISALNKKLNESGWYLGYIFHPPISEH